MKFTTWRVAIGAVFGFAAGVLTNDAGPAPQQGPVFAKPPAYTRLSVAEQACGADGTAITNEVIFYAPQLSPRHEWIAHRVFAEMEPDLKRAILSHPPSHDFQDQIRPLLTEFNARLEARLGYDAKFRISGRNVLNEPNWIQKMTSPPPPQFAKCSQA